MFAKPAPSLSFVHGVPQLASVDVDTYNAELRDAEGFVSDRASERAFDAILEKWRERLREVDEDPLGNALTGELKKRKLDKLLTGDEGGIEAAGLVHTAVEEFAQDLATVVRRFLRLEVWRDTQRIAVGGGMRASRVGELAIGRASVLLRADGYELELRPIHHHPDEAGLIGSVHLVPSWFLAGHDAILAVEVGGTTIRAGLVELNRKKARDLSAARIAVVKLWRHRDIVPASEEAVDRLASMLRELVRRANKDELHLAPLVGVDCPGLIRNDGAIKRGGPNLPGSDWEGDGCNLPRRIRELVPEIGEHETAVLMHNDAVVQGLSEAPYMRDVQRWGVLTLGNGLGNARFTNR